jgi:hypothetical protein
MIRLKIFLLLCVTFFVSLCAKGETYRLPVIGASDVALALMTQTDPLKVEYPLDVMLSLTTPQDERPITLPLQAQHVQGFSAVEGFEVSSDVMANERLTQWRYQLTLAAEGPWRILPFVLVLENQQTKTTREILVQGMTFPAPQALPSAEGRPEINLAPERVPLSWKDLWLWIKAHPFGLALGALVLLLACLWKLWLRPIVRYLKERTLPPEKRAAIEFERLRAQGWIEQGDLKRFFYELTAVVRRYFERAYALRATRQTTQEFLQALATDIPLETTTLEAMQHFLQRADRIKFAGIASSREEAEASDHEAHVLIENDARARSLRAKGTSEVNDARD